MPLLGGRCDPTEHKVAWAEVYLHTKWHLSPSMHALVRVLLCYGALEIVSVIIIIIIQPFGHNGHWPKIGGGLCPLGPHLTQCRLG